MLRREMNVKSNYDLKDEYNYYCYIIRLVGCVPLGRLGSSQRNAPRSVLVMLED